jgi:hypothetical protein
MAGERIEFISLGTKFNCASPLPEVLTNDDHEVRTAIWSGE